MAIHVTKRINPELVARNCAGALGNVVQSCPVSWDMLQEDRAYHGIPRMQAGVMIWSQKPSALFVTCDSVRFVPSIMGDEASAVSRLVKLRSVGKMGKGPAISRNLTPGVI